MFHCILCLSCNMETGVGRYELIRIVDRHVIRWNMGVQLFLWQRSISVIVGWFAGRTWKNKWCASPTKLLWMTPAVCRPMPWRKLHVKPATWYITAVRSPINCECSICGCVITCAVRIAVARPLKVENFHLTQSPHLDQRNFELWENLFSALCHILSTY